jgi:hypothetical protein
MRKYCVFQLTSPDNKIFIGHSCRPTKRLREFYNNRNNPLTYDYNIHQEMRKYPCELWTIKILGICSDLLSVKVYQQMEINNALQLNKKLINDIDHNLNPLPFHPFH